ncbi:MAG: 4-hydroxy-3-methylbut-2-enyl diphosphate reductase [Acidobacteria bacterium]|nr:4-hydroxy-3-methylbut-2-enyl diphosphate reductase [Acidobacteriota bacterium]MBI3422316.1 4-hydroxy-3-methylbut-2-enyl diphosphate reductase [Acidobacteriota bacterium]
MEIVLAESLGFCMGVKRAVDLAYRALDKAAGQPVVTLGPLIHNAQEIDRLQRDGIGVTEVEAIPASGTVVIRAHGVTPQAFDQLKSRGLRIMDGTCPYVHYSQRRASELYREGYTVVIVGDAKHPEIVGILGYINNDAYAVKTVEEAEALPRLARIGTIAQTTISPQKYNAIIEVLKTKAPEVRVCETICDATTENQGAIRALAGEVELLYVIGGRHSANSVKLVETAREQCPRATLIETADEIDPADLRGVRTVGVSAGASTPDWMIQRVVERLRELDRQINALAA